MALSFLMSSCITSKNKTDFNLLFGSGFRNDRVSLEINDILVFNNKIMNTDSVIGIVLDNGITFSQNKIKLIDKIGESPKEILFDSNESKLKFVIEINQKPYLFYPNLKEGQNLILQKDKYYYNMYLNQSKKVIKLE